MENTLELYRMAAVLIDGTLLVTLAIVVVLAIARRRRWILPLLRVIVVLIIAFGTIAIYAPFSRATQRRTDRVRGAVEVPARTARALSRSVTITVALSVVFLAVAERRRAPAYARTSARTIFIVLCGLIAHFWIWVAILPMTDDWMPAEWRHPELLQPFRPCRGALLWEQNRNSTPITLGRVDDLWSRFADPRLHGAEIRAVSIEMEYIEGYAWLTMAEAAKYRVRADDPAVQSCDARFRAERVTPATWHELGFDWR